MSLHDLLAELADDAPTGGVPPALTWRRGRRIGLVRRAGFAVIAVKACLALAVVGAAAWRAGRPAPVRPASGVGALPTVLVDPSPWTPGTAADPIGPLAIVDDAPRKTWFSTTDSWYGVSAATGTYRFLDLPDALEPGDVGGGDQGIALSPDGRHVAYWLVGAPTGSPARGAGAGPSVVGVGVYDTVTGGVERHLVATRHGISPDLLAWTAADTLVFRYGNVSSWANLIGPGPGAQAWHLGTSPVRATRSERHRAEAVWNQPHGGVNGYSFGPVASPDGRYAVRAPQGSVLSLARVGPRGKGGDWRVVQPRTSAFSVVGWVDDDTLVVIRGHSRTSGLEIDLVSVDLDLRRARVGKEHVITTNVGRARYATDLFGSPSVTRPAPPRPWDPRVTAGLELGTVIIAVLAAAAWWRRRVRP